MLVPKVKLFVLLSFMSFFVDSICAAPALFEKSVQSYDTAKYDESIDLLKQIIEMGEATGKVYHNLASAYYRKGQLGESMSAILKARELMPRDPDVRANLRFIHEKTIDKVSFEESGGFWSLFFLDQYFSQRELLYSACLFWVLAFLFLAVRLFVLKESSSLHISALCSLLLALFLFLNFYVSSFVKSQWAAVVVQEAKIRSGPDVSNTTVFKLHDGAPVSVQDEKRGWLLVAISDGKKGWVNSSEIRYYR